MASKTATLRERIRRWWEGESIPYKNVPPPELEFMDGTFKRHWTARLARATVEFYRREWEWLLMFVLAVIGAIVGLKKL